MILQFYNNNMIFFSQHHPITSSSCWVIKVYFYATIHRFEYLMSNIFCVDICIQFFLTYSWYIIRLKCNNMSEGETKWNFSWCKIKKWKRYDHDGTRTHNLPIRSRTPYPLGHAATISMKTVIILSFIIIMTSSFVNHLNWVSNYKEISPLATIYYINILSLFTQQRY